MLRSSLERQFDKTNFISPKRTPPKSPHCLGINRKSNIHTAIVAEWPTNRQTNSCAVLDVRGLEISELSKHKGSSSLIRATLAWCSCCRAFSWRVTRSTLLSSKAFSFSLVRQPLKGKDAADVRVVSWLP